MVRILSETARADGSVSAAGIEYPIAAGGGIHNYALNPGTQRLAISNGPNPQLISYAMATPIIASTTDGTVFSTAAWAPVVGQNYLIFIVTPSGGSPTSVVKTGATVGPNTSVTGAASARTLAYTALGTATTSSALTVTFPTTQTGCFIAVLAVTGAHASATTQSAVQQNLYTTATGGSVAAGSGGATSGSTQYRLRHRSVVGVVYQDTNVVPATDSGFSLIASGTMTVPSAAVVVKYRITNWWDGLFSQNSLTATGMWMAVGINPPAPGDVDLTGMANGWEGRQVVVQNISSSNLAENVSANVLYEDIDDVVVLRHDSTSTAGSKLWCPGNTDYYLGAGSSVTLIYDSTISGVGGWRVIANQRYGPMVRIFTASSTWTPPLGLDHIVVEVVGGGGGGGGTATCASGESAGAAGGGSGGYTRRVIQAGDLIATGAITVTVGAAGAASAAGNSTGGTGGTSLFDHPMYPLTANGGVGGAGSPNTTGNSRVSGGSGGSASGGDFTAGGNDGGGGTVVTAAPVLTGMGGGSIFGGASKTVSASAGQGGGAWGAGGSGATQGSTGAARAGGAGIGGIIIITEHYS